MLGIAVKPEFGTADRAPGQGLLHKGAGQQRHLVKQRPRQGDALDPGGGALIASPKEIEAVLPASVGEGQLIFGKGQVDRKAQSLQGGQQRG